MHDVGAMRFPQPGQLTALRKAKAQVCVVGYRIALDQYFNQPLALARRIIRRLSGAYQLDQGILSL